MKLKYKYTLKSFIDSNEDELMNRWDEYKYEKYCDEVFHHDDVDFFDEGLFTDMCSDIYEMVKEGVNAD
jgi:hypothetical protein